MSCYARCRADEVSIAVGERSRRFGVGAFVDLDEPITSTQTIRDVLGHRIDAFEVFEEARSFAEAAAAAHRRETAALAASMTAHDATDATEPDEPSPDPDRDLSGADGAPQPATADPALAHEA